jgi:hypothetical protein
MREPQAECGRGPKSAHDYVHAHSTDGVREQTFSHDLGPCCPHTVNSGAVKARKYNDTKCLFILGCVKVDAVFSISILPCCRCGVVPWPRQSRKSDSRSATLPMDPFFFTSLSGAPGACAGQPESRRLTCVALQCRRKQSEKARNRSDCLDVASLAWPGAPALSA